MVIFMYERRDFRRDRMKREYVEEKEEKPKPEKKPKLVKIPKSLEKPIFVKSKNGKVLHVSSKRKTAIARASVKKGKGKITINKIPYTLISNKYLLDVVKEPIVLVEEYKQELPSQIDIAITVKGGGTIGQMVAVRNCIAKAFVQYFNDVNLAHKISTYNRSFLIDDERRVEAKKPLGTKARAKKQHSKR